jgi:hypothetical protein
MDNLFKASQTGHLRRATWAIRVPCVSPDGRRRVPEHHKCPPIRHFRSAAAALLRVTAVTPLVGGGRNYFQFQILEFWPRPAQAQGCSFRSVRVLLLCAEHLFVGALVAAAQPHRLLALVGCDAPTCRRRRLSPPRHRSVPHFVCRGPRADCLAFLETPAPEGVFRLTRARGVRPPGLAEQTDTAPRSCRSWQGSPDEARNGPVAPGLRKVLADAGWVEGRNLRSDWRWAVNDPALARRHATELVALQPELSRGSEQVNDQSPRSTLGHRRGDAVPAEKFRQVLARVEHSRLHSVHWNSNNPRDIFD